jgi:hypothetical protein
VSGQLRIIVRASMGRTATLLVPADSAVVAAARSAATHKTALRFPIDNPELIKDPLARQLVVASPVRGRNHVEIPKGKIVSAQVI